MDTALDRKTLRRKEILAAALDCFVQYGFAKTVFDDVAQKAGVSRSLLYAYFEDKKHLFLAVFHDVLEEQRKKTQAALRSRAGAKEKFLQVLELWGVELYAKSADNPHGVELMEEGLRVWEQAGVKYRDYLIRALAPFVGGADAAEFVVLAIKGLQSDRPTVPALSKRVKLLADLAWQRRGRPGP